MYADVKHMNGKETDGRDEATMAAAGFELVQVGNVIDDEGEHGYQGMCWAAIKKEPQYLNGEQNTLIFVSYSASLDLLLPSVRNEFGDSVRKANRFAAEEAWGHDDFQGPSTGFSNVVFCANSYPHRPIGHKIASALGWGQLAWQRNNGAPLAFHSSER